MILNAAFATFGTLLPSGLICCIIRCARQRGWDFSLTSLWGAVGLSVAPLFRTGLRRTKSMCWKRVPQARGIFHGRSILCSREREEFSLLWQSQRLILERWTSADLWSLQSISEARAGCAGTFRQGGGASCSSWILSPASK